MKTHKTIFIFIIIFEIFVTNGFSDINDSIIFKTLNRQKRKLPLIFHGIGVSQFVCGFGIPLDTDFFESVTSGIVFKSQLPLPTQVKDLRNHATHNVNGGRYMNTSDEMTTLNEHLRWEFYKMLELWANSMGLEGRTCVLKTLCEVAQMPFDNTTGDLWHEIVHILFTPQTSLDNIAHYSNNAYLAAVHTGSTINNTCDRIFRECPKSILNIFSNVF